MNNTTTVSIIIPVYNAEEYLEQCIDSITGQTYGNIEVILVDDGSTDGSGTICDDYAARDNRIKVIHQENQGLVRTWVRGTKESSGDYLCYVDSDDWIEPDMMEALLSQTTGNSKEMICSNISCDFPDRQIIEKNKLAPGVYEGETLKEIQYERLLGNDERTILFSRCTKLIARSLIVDNIKYSDPTVKMGEDLNITLPAMLDSERIVILDRTFYHYRQYISSMVHAYNEKLYSEVRQLTGVIRYILNEKKIPNAEEMAAKEYIILMILVVKNELRGNPRYVETLQELFTERENRRILKTTPVQVRETAKRLIYFGMKHPNKLCFLGLKKLMEAKGAF